MTTQHPSIFLIEKLWADPFENIIDRAIRYSPIGYTQSEQEAKDFCDQQGFITAVECWAINERTPKYRYREIKPLETLTRSQEMADVNAGLLGIKQQKDSEKKAS